jgi:hypothetical protein
MAYFFVAPAIRAFGPRNAEVSGQAALDAMGTCSIWRDYGKKARRFSGAAPIRPDS